MTDTSRPDRLTGADARLVDLAESVLVDPNVHTDQRMRLHRQINELLRSAHHEIHGVHGPQVHASRVREADGQASRLLSSVLSDPELTDDMRMRLHREIPRLLEAARRHAARR